MLPRIRSQVRPRDDNTAVDMLSKLCSDRKPIPPGIFLEHLRIPSVKGADEENPDMAVSPAKEVMCYHSRLDKASPGLHHASVVAGGRGPCQENSEKSEILRGN